jgi:flagellar motor protein MotB
VTGLDAALKDLDGSDDPDGRTRNRRVEIVVRKGA